MSEQGTENRDREGRRPDLSLVIPCYNEQDVLRATAGRLLAAFKQHGIDLDLILVDNGSTDGTGTIIDELIADENSITKVQVEVNRGYGNGILRGLSAVRGRMVGFAAADGQVSEGDIVRLYEIAAASTSPRLVKVRRRFRMDGLRRKVISIGYNLLANLVFLGLRSIDINGNPKIFPSEYLDQMKLSSEDWFLDTEVMIKAKQLGLEVYERNVIAQMREGGQSHVRVGTIWEFVGNLARYALLPGNRVGGRSARFQSGNL